MVSSQEKSERACPKCGSTRWAEVAEGGLALNIMCENRHVYWLGFGFKDMEYLYDMPKREIAAT